MAESLGTLELPDVTWRSKLTHLPSVALLLCIAAWRVVILFSPLPLNDFIAYWASGKLFLTGANPYSPTAVFNMERSLGWALQQPLMMFYPPWALPFAAAMGSVPFQVSHYGWSILSTVLDVISALALWRYFGGSRKKQWVVLLLLASFTPASGAEHMVQFTPLILAAIVALLYALRYELYSLAGGCLVLLSIKPHLTYLVTLAVVLWSFQMRKWRPILTALSCTALVLVLEVLFNPNILHYFDGTVHSALDVSCGLGAAVHDVFGDRYAWFRFVPLAGGFAWFLWHWSKNKHSWVWEEQLPILTLVSISTSPYFWAHDYILALPAFVALLAQEVGRREDWLLPTLFYVALQYAIAQAGAVSSAWMPAASLLWLVYFVLFRKLSVNKNEPLSFVGSGVSVSSV